MKKYERVRRELVHYPVPDDWVPDPFGEKLWLEELEALTDEERRNLDRFLWTAEDFDNLIITRAEDQD